MLLTKSLERSTPAENIDTSANLAKDANPNDPLQRIEHMISFVSASYRDVRQEVNSDGLGRDGCSGIRCCIGSGPCLLPC